MLDTQVNGVASLSGTFLFLTTVTVLLRFLARYKQKAYVSVDDYLIVCGWVRSLSLSGCTYLPLYNPVLAIIAPLQTWD
jgi:hypothetical protein